MSGRFRRAVRSVTLFGHWQILDWWLTKYLPLNKAEGFQPKPLESIIDCDHSESAFWLHERISKLLQTGIEGFELVRFAPQVSSFSVSPPFRTTYRY